jgi:hypothetical protein
MIWSLRLMYPTKEPIWALLCDVHHIRGFFPEESNAREHVRVFWWLNQGFMFIYARHMSYH